MTKTKTSTKTLVTTAIISAAVGAAVAAGFVAISPGNIIGVRGITIPSLSGSYLPGYVAGYVPGYVPGYGLPGYISGYGVFLPLTTEGFETELKKYLRPNITDLFKKKQNRRTRSSRK